MTKEIVVHLIRTVVLVAIFTVLLMGGFVASLLWLPAGFGLVLLPIGIGAFVYGSARWHPYWAPVSKPIFRRRWQTDSGVKMETVVEWAVVQAGIATQSKTLRISMYDRGSGRRVKRILIGDSANFLGLKDSTLWFFIDDRFHFRKDGLVGIDSTTGKCVHHQPKKDCREGAGVRFQSELGRQSDDA